jgi:hypothetical protein
MGAPKEHKINLSVHINNDAPMKNILQRLNGQLEGLWLGFPDFSFSSAARARFSYSDLLLPADYNTTTLSPCYGAILSWFSCGETFYFFVDRTWCADQALWCCIFFALVILFCSDRVLCSDLFPSVVMRAESVVGADPLLVMGCSHFFRVHLPGFLLVFFLLISIFSPERIPILQVYVVSPSHLPLLYWGREDSYFAGVCCFSIPPPSLVLGSVSGSDGLHVPSFKV